MRNDAKELPSTRYHSNPGPEVSYAQSRQAPKRTAPKANHEKASHWGKAPKEDCATNVDIFFDARLLELLDTDYSDSNTDEKEEFGRY